MESCFHWKNEGDAVEGIRFAQKVELLVSIA